MTQEKGSVEGFFGSHAQGYSKSQSHAHGTDLATLVGALGPKPTDVALDVATGTGFTAVALAPLVRQVTGIDVTREMLEEAKRLAASEGLTNVTFEVGDALDIKAADGSFDITTTRRATHHFADVPRFIQEAKRVLKPGGRLGVVDMSPPEGTEVFSNRIEKLRDSSHVEAFTPSRWRSMVSEAGLEILSFQVLDEQISFEKWLYPVGLGGPEEGSIRRAWADTSSEVRELLNAVFEGEAVRGWTKSRMVLIASKP
ncbi:MAG: methyltransferase domain-containing protein [Nitrososphaerota archaeon]|jgi:ubiquinone/menaquinone biosynthesis C-methylase UbiE|nr:methyltransferase domain-containing protein [Nitrososphaerota archaeon]MDG6953263.1 methyltransferase domain-containing protein [Nitrososphaerota archaeon]MDG6956939.1 methyltransferase domain-containing protein [Nitrososphaerota archaeon]MDG6958537.1 methyltransferase domain-containing protein [Nitrososphaerota archaeon]MDG6960439.1 methyltransferase domain-containing protein [Nitrososphaerota archaeon]